ncbi:MAG TPA: biosynthetic-type acetolactate synthase large subunit [Ruminococcaceae bacterium]|nr:biosynthetic-type acetolactate synthase large subunit [Oscillospiraceae bacterium]
MPNGAEIMIECLKNEGVEVVFGYPGAAICPFYDELPGSGIKHVLVRHEQHAAHAASGYARSGGKPGVCVATSGPGATNLITGIATAYMDSVPMVAITGQVSSDLLGRDVFQEVDITGACEPFTKHSYLVRDARELCRVFKEAFHIAGTGRPGPVLIDIPIDIQKQQTDSFSYPEKADIIGYKPNVGGHAIQIKKAVQAINAAQRPVICAGGGVFSAGGESRLARFAEKLQIPIVSTMMGIGVLPSANPLNLGMMGSHGVASANMAVRRADLLILCGARVGDRAVASPEQVEKRTKIIHIDIDPAEIGKNIGADIPIVGDIRKVLGRLLEQTEAHWPRAWSREIAELKKPPSAAQKPGFIEPRYFMRTLSELMRDDCILTADVGQNQIWSANNFEIKNSRLLTSCGLGTMGYSLPAAIGAQSANPEKQVCCVLGDGSFQMNFMELATAVQNSLPVKIVVMRNTKLGMVNELQRNLYGCRESGVDLTGSPDFIKLAAAYGIPAEEISENAAAPQAIKRMLETGGPYILQCAVNPDETSFN